VYLDSERRLGSFLRAIPHRPALREISSLTLAPFEYDIDDLPLCSWVRELFCFTCESLTKLVIDIPLRTCYPEDDHLAVRPVLREGFERLVNLVEFVSTQDELYLDVVRRENACVWEQWPKLKRLALYNVAADETFWRRVAHHPSLDVLILSNPDCINEVDPKAAFLKHATRSLSATVCYASYRRMDVPDYASHSTWKAIDPKGRLMIMFKCITDDLWERDTFQACIRSAGEDGSLWHWQGEEITHPEQFSVRVD
jgi:hypothetical protein|tara:strand:- start:7750 stop:8514 length:765 start_codon:yes stop_codon:yes gene_type:complete